MVELKKDGKVIHTTGRYILKTNAFKEFMAQFCQEAFTVGSNEVKGMTLRLGRFIEFDGKEYWYDEVQVY